MSDTYTFDFLKNWFSSDETAFDLMLDELVDITVNGLVEIKHSLEVKDIQEIQGIAHRIKGPLKGFGFDDSFCYICEIEKAAKEKQVDLISNLVKDTEIISKGLRDDKSELIKRLKSK